ncbi:MAG: DUF1559 domain-containing protein [Planctomycetes bacterium]|nr:DUF1559 domain-containing protein [Planctomycetota bacterium]
MWRRRSKETGVTIIELLVAIFIVGLLAAISVPAVQSARESSRRVQCLSNLRQIGQAFHMHHEAHRHFPSGGWGYRWQPDPGRGLGRHQPGGWPYAVLPYLEQQVLRGVGGRLSDADERSAMLVVVQTPLPVFHCPSRRSANAYPYSGRSGFVNLDRPASAARSDYSANAGDLQPGDKQWPGRYGPGPESLAEGDSPMFHWTQLDRTGIVYRRSETNLAALRDGASNIYLIGEGYLNPEHYVDGLGMNDDQGMYVGYDRDTLRITHPDAPPMRDTRGVEADHSFGSAHPGGFHVAFADGSARLIRFTITPDAHRRMGNRADGQPVDASEL